MDLMYCSGDLDIPFQDLIECDLKFEVENDDLMTELANGPLLSEDGFDDLENLDGQLVDPYTFVYGCSSSAATIIKSSANAQRQFLNGHSNGSNSNSNYSNISFDEQYGIMVDPSSIVPVTVSGSLGSTGSVSETDLGTDEDEDDAELASQGWIVTKADGIRSPSPIQLQQADTYEIIEEPEFIITEAEPVVEGPPQKKRKQKHELQPHSDGKIYPKPGFSYSCLIAMSLKNSKVGSLPVSEIYKFMCDHFPYFKTAPSGWKNSVRHNLSLNKCFEKIEKPGNAARKGCLWALNPSKTHKMDEEIQKWLKKDTGAVLRAMSDPENLNLIERGELKRDYSGNGGGSDEDEEDEFGEPLTPMRPTQGGGRNSRQHSIDTAVVGGETIITATPITMSQIRATLQQQHLKRVIEQKKAQGGTTVDDQSQTIDISQLGSVQGNYLCHSNGTFTFSFTGLNQPTTPIIIRRTPVK